MIYYDVKICCYYINAKKERATFTFSINKLRSDTNLNQLNFRYDLVMGIAREQNYSCLLDALDIHFINMHHKADKNLPCLICILEEEGRSIKPTELEKVDVINLY